MVPQVSGYCTTPHDAAADAFYFFLGKGGFGYSMRRHSFC